jgi:hypothetical protein
MCICGTVVKLLGRAERSSPNPEYRRAEGAGLDGEGADRAIILSAAMRVVIGRCPRVRVPVFTENVPLTRCGDIRVHWSKRGWAERALQRLQEQLEPLRVELNREKTKMVDTYRTGWSSVDCSADVRLARYAVPEMLTASDAGVA